MSTSGTGNGEVNRIGTSDSSPPEHELVMGIMRAVGDIHLQQKNVQLLEDFHVPTVWDTSAVNIISDLFVYIRYVILGSLLEVWGWGLNPPSPHLNPLLDFNSYPVDGSHHTSCLAKTQLSPVNTLPVSRGQTSIFVITSTLADS